ncbi:MAG: GNAT family N-acetyltransferase, partial [Defluviitaleaceae bacterium]|nr:GNAT family N-acetyltransferase [Defluviitaleaceae bacterium]
MHIYETLENGVNIVEFEPGMAQAVADMWNQSWESWGGESAIQTAANVLSDVCGGAYKNVFVAEKDGEALGFASLSVYYADSDALYLHVLNVRPDWHGAKLGKALVLKCVNRTIELGYPRLDIHTWPGNTKAVPVYKKCGYMWEDRVDSTHLVNFIPTVLKTEACAYFFENADWYADSARTIEIVPDGVKENKFELFKYSWEKDGRRLSAGFERTGRRLRLLETDDYRVELIAESHELAFGLEYDCSFVAVNKSGAPLNIKISGNDDKNVSLKYDAEGDVIGSRSFDARFFVGEIDEPQDIWRPHPCVQAEVLINGKSALFGLGIETKWPAGLSVDELKRICVPGAEYDCFFNITSALRQNAKIKIKLPERNRVVGFDFCEREIDVEALGRVSFKARAASEGYGHEAASVEYEVVLADGREVRYKRPYHFVSRGLCGAFHYESETGYSISSGPWQLTLGKNGAYAWSNHATGSIRAPGYPIGQLGRPYSDEFTRMKPVSVKYEISGDSVKM